MHIRSRKPAPVRVCGFEPSGLSWFPRKRAAWFPRADRGSPQATAGQPRSTSSSKTFTLTDETTDQREVNPTGSALWHNDLRGSITREGYGEVLLASHPILHGIVVDPARLRRSDCFVGSFASRP